LVVNDPGADHALTTDDINYTAITATVGSASFTGIPGLTATVSNATLAVNKTSDVSHANKVLDFFDTPEETNTTDSAAAAFAVPGTALTLALDGDEGALLQADADLNLNLFGLLSANG